MERNRVDEHSTCRVVGKNFEFYNNTGEFIDKIQERMPTKARFNTQHPDHGKRCANGDILLVATTNKDREQIIVDTAPEKLVGSKLLNLGKKVDKEYVRDPTSENAVRIVRFDPNYEERKKQDKNGKRAANTGKTNNHNNTGFVKKQRRY